MKKILKVPIGCQNEERIIAQALKNVRRRFEYAFKDGSTLYLVFSLQEMKIKTIVKQFRACDKEEGIKFVLSQKTFENDGVNSVWRVAGEIQLSNGRGRSNNSSDKTICLVFFEKTLDN